MFDQPNRAALLEVAHRTLVEDVLPHLDEDRRYAGLTVARAIAMVMRELESDATHEPVRRVLDRFADLYGQDNVSDAGRDGAERIASLNRHLVRELRDGQYDDALLGPVLDLLLEQAEQRVKLSNRDFIGTGTFSQPMSA